MQEQQKSVNPSAARFILRKVAVKEMPFYPNIFPVIAEAGIVYAKAALLPAAEGDVFNGVGQDPIPAQWNQAISADVVFQAQGNLSSNTSYVVLQTSFGDGQWFDVAWCTFTGLSGSQAFTLSATSDAAAVAGTVQQTRAAGTAPNPTNGSNNVQMGPLCRFVGKSSTNAGSSSSSSSSAGAGPQPGVTVSIRYRQTGLR